MTTKRGTHFVLWVVLVPSYILAALFLYWLFIQPAPMELKRFGPFTSGPVGSYEDAKRLEITEAASNSSVWVWEEWCLHKATSGTVSSVWINGFVQKTPDGQTIGREGCHGKSFMARTPHADRPELFTLRKSITYDTNPLRHDVVRYPEITLMVRP